MRSDREAMMLVRADLCERLEALRKLPRAHSERAFTESVISIRRLASLYGMTPVVRLTEALEREIGSSVSGAACPKSLYLDRMSDAIGCDRLDEQASEAMIASVSVRFV